MESRSSEDELLKVRDVPLVVSLSNHERRDSPFDRLRTSVVFSVLCVLCVLCVDALAQTPDRARTEALARRATERLQALQREADRLASEERSLIDEVRKLEIERQLRAEELKRVDADAAKLQKELDATGERMVTLEATDKKET